MLFLFRSAPEVEKRIHSKLFRKFSRSRGTKEPAYITVIAISTYYWPTSIAKVTTKCVHNPLLTLRGHHLGHFGDQLKTLRTTPGHHLGQLGHLTTWHQLGSCVATLEHYLGQLRDNFDTTLGQLGDNFEITLRQLWDNFETSLGQLGYNCETTLRQLGTTLGPHGNYYYLKTIGGAYLFFSSNLWSPLTCFFPLGCLNVYKICLKIWFGHLKCRYWYPQNSKNLIK